MSTAFRFVVLITIAMEVMTTTARAQDIGELSVGGGFAQGIENGGLGTSGIATASFGFIASAFSLGPEFRYIAGTPHVIGYGLVARFRPSRGRFYVVGGLGGNSWRRMQRISTSLFSGSVGAGVLMAAGRSPDRLGIELRLHDNLQNIDGGNWAFLTLTGSVRFDW
ncbi:MAG: hypothetical protein ABI613_11395 [Gemmatimonadota bacterium]